MRKNYCSQSTHQLHKCTVFELKKLHFRKFFFFLFLIFQKLDFAPSGIQCIQFIFMYFKDRDIDSRIRVFEPFSHFFFKKTNLRGLCSGFKCQNGVQIQKKNVAHSILEHVAHSIPEFIKIKINFFFSRGQVFFFQI